MRQPGFYWVKYSDWTIGYWNGIVWSIKDQEIPFYDWMFDEIEENKLEH